MRYSISHADLPLQHTAVVRGRVTVEEIPAFLGRAFKEVLDVVAAGPPVIGPPFARYRVDDGWFDVEAGFPVRGTVEPMGQVEPSTLPAGRVARTLHQGPYAEVAAAYEALETWVVENGYRPTGAPWESYLDDPDVPDPRTEVYLPCVEAHR